MRKLLLILGIFLAVNAFADLVDTNEPTVSLSKIPWGVVFSLKGTVTNVVADQETIRFEFHGWFYLRQYSWNGITNEQVIKMDFRKGTSANVKITDFVATVPNVNAAAVRTKEALLPIFKAAEQRQRELTISLDPAKLNFDSPPFVENARVWRITDWDLH